MANMPLDKKSLNTRLASSVTQCRDTFFQTGRTFARLSRSWALAGSGTSVAAFGDAVWDHVSHDIGSGLVQSGGRT
jgi:hypothetical protein